MNPGQAYLSSFAAVVAVAGFTPDPVAHAHDPSAAPSQEGRAERAAEWRGLLSLAVDDVQFTDERIECVHWDCQMIIGSLSCDPILTH